MTCSVIWRNPNSLYSATHTYIHSMTEVRLSYTARRKGMFSVLPEDTTTETDGVGV